MSETAKDVFVGIDVSKEWGDIAVRPTGMAWRAAQDEAGINALVPQLASCIPRWWSWRPRVGMRCGWW